MTLQLPPDTPASAARRRAIYGIWQSGKPLHGSSQTSNGSLARIKSWLFGFTRKPNTGTPTSNETNPSGWLKVEWLYARHVPLDGRSAAECFQAEPTRIAALARQEFALDHFAQRQDQVRQYL